MGETRVRVHSGQLEEDLNLLAVKGNGPSLLSHDWLAKIRLDWESIRKLHHQDSTLEEVLDTQDIFASLAGGKVFSKLDLAHAYQQLRLDADSHQYVTINTHKGLFRYTRPPFGVSTAPAIFQRMMEAIFRELPHVNIYLEDILITGESEAKHLQNLSAVLGRLKAAGVRLKQKKCSFMMSEVEYLGHRISAKGLHPLPSKIRAIQEAPTPTEVSQLHSFLRLLGYYGHFGGSSGQHSNFTDNYQQTEDALRYIHMTCQKLLCQTMARYSLVPSLPPL